MIHAIAALLAYARFLFWKGIVQTFGGSIGPGTRIYERVKIFTSSTSPVRVGKDCVVQQGAVLAASGAGRLILGDHVYLGEYVILSSRGSIEIGDHTILAAHTFVVDFDHAFEDPNRLIHEQGYKIRPVVIGKDVWIGAGCKILKGIRVGQGSVIGAGSVVTCDIPPYTVWAGIPARMVRARSLEKGPGAVSPSISIGTS